MHIRKYFATIDLKTIIYFSALIIIYAGMWISQKLTLDTFAYVLALATIAYVFITKRWHYFQTALSLFTIVFALAILQSTFYQFAIKDPSFIVSSLLFAYFFVIFMTTLTNHAEWSIRSVWVATTLGALGAGLTETMLIMLAKVNNVYIVGLDGIIVMFIIAGLYMTIGKKVRVVVPERYKEFDTNKLEGHLEHIGLTAEKNKKGDLIVKDEMDNTRSYKVFLSKDKIVIRDTDRIVDNFILVRDKKITPIYAWLLRESSRSFEVRGPKPIKSEQFIIINVAERTSGTKIVEVPIPRTTRTHNVALITIANKDMKKVGRLIEQATVMLNSK